MSTLSCTNSNEYEDNTKCRGSGIYAEIGDKNYEAMLSAKMASLDDDFNFSPYVPMAAIPDALMLAAHLPNVAPPAYSSVVPAANNTVARSLDPSVMVSTVNQVANTTLEGTSVSITASPVTNIEPDTSTVTPCNTVTCTQSQNVCTVASLNTAMVPATNAVETIVDDPTYSTIIAQGFDPTYNNISVAATPNTTFNTATSVSSISGSMIAVTPAITSVAPASGSIQRIVSATPTVSLSSKATSSTPGGSVQESEF